MIDNPVIESAAGTAPRRWSRALVDRRGRPLLDLGRRRGPATEALVSGADAAARKAKDILLTSPGPADWAERDPSWSGVRTEILSVMGRPIRSLRHDATPADGVPQVPQLFLHGLGGSACNWLEVMGPLSRFGECVAVDFPGFGATPIPPAGSARVRANAGFVRALLDHLGWERAAIYGNSMGGLIATLAAARDPERVVRLVLVNPALPAPRRAMFKISGRVMSRILPTAVPGLGRLLVEVGFRAKTAEELVQETLNSVMATTEHVRACYRQVLVENVERAKADAWRRTALAEAACSLVTMIAEADELNHAIDSISAPTLLLWGDVDRLVSRYVIEGVVARRPEWSQHTFPHVGHAPMVEVPDRFVDVVSSFHVSAANTTASTPGSGALGVVHEQMLSGGSVLRTAPGAAPA